MIDKSGRPQPKKVHEQPETITVRIPVDIAIDWLHGADRPELEDLIQEALEKKGYDN